MISVQSNIDEVIGFIDRLSPQAPFAIALALTRTAQDLQKEIYDEERRVFDRPTPYTLSSMYVGNATKQNLMASVQLKDRRLSKTQRDHEHTIGHEFRGGVREHKSIEIYAISAGLLSPGEFLVPSSGARLDRYGNMSRGQVQQIMAQLRIGIDPHQYASRSRRSIANRVRAGEVFWSRGGRLPRGVWQRTRTGVIPVLMVARNVTYKQRVNVERLGIRVTNERFEGHLLQAWRRALQTAR